MSRGKIDELKATELDAVHKTICIWFQIMMQTHAHRETYECNAMYYIRTVKEYQVQGFDVCKAHLRA